MAKNAFNAWISQDSSQLFPIAVGIGLVVIGLVRFLRRQRMTVNEVGVKSGFPSPQQTLKLIQSRRTITPKDYLLNVSNPVTDVELESLLEAANWAPTHEKTEPWRFVVMSGSEAITNYLVFMDNWYQARADTLDEKALAKFRKKLEALITLWPLRLSHLVLIVMKRRAKEDKLLPEWEELCAVASAAQNFQLMAASLNGVGVLWSSHTFAQHCRDSVEMNERFGFDLKDKVLGALTVGRYDTNRKFTASRGLIADKVQYIC